MGSGRMERAWAVALAVVVWACGCAQAPGEAEFVCPRDGELQLACVCGSGRQGELVCDAQGQPLRCACEDAPDVGAPDAGDGGGPIDPPITRNACGGRGELTFEGAPAAPLEPCGECGDGALVCESAERLRCVGATARNACGGCALLRDVPGEACGECGAGTWACGVDAGGAPTGALVCEGDAEVNACGGCGELDVAPAFACVDDVSGEPGVTACVTRDEVRCIGGGTNACGGAIDLGTREPLDACGTCGLGALVCASPDALTCVDGDRGENACGGCGVLRAQPGDACGSCGGSWVCDGDEDVRCTAPVNACGGCQALPDAPGMACGPGRLQVCRGPDRLECVVTESDGEGNFTNACGGLGLLDVQPGAACGACGRGTAVCGSDADVVCLEEVGAPPTNECGGCANLPGRLGAACGFGSTYACDESDPDALICTFTGARNVCGGTAFIDPSEQPGEPCGTCGEYVCAVSGETVCAGGADTMTDPRNCGGCGVRCQEGEFCSFGVCDQDPVTQVTLGHGVTGARHACARRASGTVVCWGDNTNGQLGDGTLQRRDEPAQVVNITGAEQVVVGLAFSCARLGTGRVVCWGDNQVGQLGWGVGQVTTVQAPSPAQGYVRGVEHALDVDADGRAACAVEGADAAATSGRVVCWGRVSSGEDVLLGQPGATAGVYGATEIQGVTDAVDVEVRGTNACARTAAGDVVCWGTSAFTGQGTAAGSQQRVYPAAAVANLSDVVSLSVTSQYGCAATQSGEVLCWGSNQFGRLGRAGASRDPQLVAGVTDAEEVAVTDSTACARLRDGAVVCWGREQGAGRGVVDGDRSTPQRVLEPARVGFSPDQAATMSGAVSLVGGRGYAFCATFAAGQVRCWGNDTDDVLGYGITVRQSLVATLTRPLPSPLFPPVEGEHARCGDGIDNDSDGLTDCLDPDCAEDIGQAVGVAAHLSYRPEWLPYEETSCNNNPTRHVTLRYLWTAPRAGTFRFSTGGSGSSYAPGSIELRATSCAGPSVGCGGAGQVAEATVAAGQQLFVVVEAQVQSTVNTLVQLDVTEAAGP